MGVDSNKYLYFMGLFDSLTKKSNKKVVGIAITPGIGIELAVYDNASNSISNYGRRSLEYNLATREIQNMAEFKTALLDLMEKNFIELRTNAYIILPNIFFDSHELPADMQPSEISMALETKAEDFYLFKREEPSTGWCEILNTNNTQKKYVYSAFQKRIIDNIKEIVADVGLNLIGIETSHSAVLRGLRTAGVIDELVLEDASWTAMVVNPNSYALFQMDGKNLINFSENPIAVKSLSADEAYQAIALSSEEALTNFPSSKLILISQTNDINANVLKTRMKFDREIVAIDTNKFSQRSIMDVVNTEDINDAKSLTLSVIGGANPNCDLDLSLNILRDVNAKKVVTGPYFTKIINGKEVEVNQEYVQKACISIGGIALVVLGLLAGAAFSVDNFYTTKNTELDSEIQNIQGQIQALESAEKKPAVDLDSVIDEVAAMSVNAVSFYDSIATDIPKNVWLTQYYNQAGDRIAIRGIAQSLFDIYEYYKNLKAVIPQIDLKLTDLKAITSANQEGSEDRYISDLVLGKGGDRLYSFEISNTPVEFSQIRGDDNTSNGKDGASNTYNPSLQGDKEDILIAPVNSNSGNNANENNGNNVEQVSEQVTPAK